MRIFRHVDLFGGGELEQKNVSFKCIDGSNGIINSVFGVSEVINCGGYLWNKVYRRSLVVGKEFNTKINLGEDGLFNLEVASYAKRLCITSAPLYFYRNSENSTKTRDRNFELWEREYKEYKTLLKEVKDKRVESYMESMLINCCLKAAEAAVRERRPFRQYKAIQRTLNEWTDIYYMDNKKKWIQYIVLRKSIILFILIKKVILLLDTKGIINV